MINYSINWRTVIADRYGDGPNDERVGNIFKHVECRKKIAIMFDYKGILNVVWKEVPKKPEVKEVNQAWEDIGGECDNDVAHYFLMPMAPPEYNKGVWDSE